MRGIRSKLFVHVLTAVALTWYLVSSVTRSLTGECRWTRGLVRSPRSRSLTPLLQHLISWPLGVAPLSPYVNQTQKIHGQAFGVRFFFACVELTHLCLCSLFIRWTWLRKYMCAFTFDFTVSTHHSPLSTLALRWVPFTRFSLRYSLCGNAHLVLCECSAAARIDCQISQAFLQSCLVCTCRTMLRKSRQLCMSWGAWTIQHAGWGSTSQTVFFTGLKLVSAPITTTNEVPCIMSHVPALLLDFTPVY